MTTKVYLGDGAYVSLEEGTVILTTEDGMHISNVVYLEPQVLEHLLRVWKQRRTHNEDCRMVFDWSVFGSGNQENDQGNRPDYLHAHRRSAPGHNEICTRL